MAEYISQSQQAITLMQTRESLKLVTEDLFKQLKDDEIIYAEIRFAPLEHIQKEPSAREVVETVNKVVEDQVEKTGIEVGVILCTLKHYSEEQSMQTVKLVEQFNDTRIIGLDIAADEAGYPIKNHISAFEYANEK